MTRTIKRWSVKSDGTTVTLPNQPDKPINRAEYRKIRLEAIKSVHKSRNQS